MSRAEDHPQNPESTDQILVGAPSVDPSRPCVIYLHGFRSSPASSKALLLADWLKADGVPYLCPALDISPMVALDEIEMVIEGALTEGYAPRLIGSSLGGYYASFFMERHPARHLMKAALINPACHAARDLATQVGWHTGWHSNERMEFKASYVDDLLSMEVGLTAPERYLLVAATGDELLDWHEMVARYPGAQHLVVEGSDHGLSDFPDHWPVIKRFLLG